MTKKDRTVIGLIVVVLGILLAVIIKNGSNQLPMPNETGKLSEPLSFEKPAAELPAPSSQARDNTASVPGNPASIAATGTSNQAAAADTAVRETTATETDAEQPPTAIELALKFQSALDGLDSEPGSADVEGSALLLVSLFAELPEDPRAEAELTRELATAYVQSSDDNEKAALVDLLLIIPSNAGLELGQTLSRSNDPDERQIGLELVANGGSPANFSE